MMMPSNREAKDQPTVIGRKFNAPLVVYGSTGLPLFELVAWGLFSIFAGQENPHWSSGKKGLAGLLSTVAFFGTEWCHDLAHAAGASWIGKPADAIRILFGTPLLIYHDVNDQSVTPTQHMLRSMGGPILNALMAPVWWLAHRFTHQGTFTRYIIDFGMGANLLLGLGALLPIPFLDGGTLLKWSLVRKGCSLAQAEDAVRKANLAVGASLAVTSGVMLNKRRSLQAAIALGLAAATLAIGTGLLKEHK